MIGWYHSGPKLRASDLEINELFKRYTPNPVLVIVDVKPKDISIPTDAYFAIEEIKDDGTATQKTFMHVPSEIEAEEAEEIGVEHLLRDIKDNAVGTLSTRVTDQLNSVRGLQTRLEDIRDYLQKVVAGQLPVNHQIIYNLQDIFNLLPNLQTRLKTSKAKVLLTAKNKRNRKQKMAKTRQMRRRRTRRLRKRKSRATNANMMYF
jgi:26S proteasome regulatory subunit N8